MKLEHFYAKVAPLLEGQSTVEQTVDSLFGANPPSEAQRLAIYERFCRAHRDTATGGVHSILKEEVIRSHGLAAWKQLVEDYFRAHPMQHVEINENGAHLAAYLAKRSDLHAHWSELADFEWWEWQTFIAPDSAADANPQQGPLRIASTVELRPYRWNFIDWLAQDNRAAAPLAENIVVLFWRNQNLEARRAIAHPNELHVLKSIHDGLAVSDCSTLVELQSAHVVLGELP